MAHTDGDVYPIIPDYIEMGLDVLNPVQPYVAEMEHEKLKMEFGDRLAFYAAIDIQKVMPFGTPEEVIRPSYQDHEARLALVADIFWLQHITSKRMCHQRIS